MSSMENFLIDWSPLYFFMGAAVALQAEASRDGALHVLRCFLSLHASTCHQQAAALPLAGALLQVEGSLVRGVFRIAGITIGALLAFAAGLNGNALNNPYYITSMVAVLIAVFSLPYPVAEMRCACCGVMSRGCGLGPLFFFVAPSALPAFVIASRLPAAPPCRALLCCLQVCTRDDRLHNACE